MATCGTWWLTWSYLAFIFWTQTTLIYGGIVNDLQAAGLGSKEKKSWSTEHIHSDLDGDQDELSPSSDKREWALDPENMDLALQEDVKRKWGNNLKVWGKRNDLTSGDHDGKRAWDNNLRVWGKRSDYDLEDEEEKRRWSGDNLRVWGKRESPYRKWGNTDGTNSWDKRAGPDVNNKRKWGNNMRVWGKRDGVEPLENEKRKWDQSMRVWGKRNGLSEDEKRSWDNQFKVWGKRRVLDMNRLNDDDAVSQNAEALTPEKKAWDSNMRVWGKRSVAKRSVESVNDDYKRGWDSDSTRVWGKRRNPQDGGPKRSWRNNAMRVWGKRSVDEDLSDALEYSPEKRKWDSQMRVWGKRGWDSSMRTWGKRTPHDLSSADLLATIHQIYDKNKDSYRR